MYSAASSVLHSTPLHAAACSRGCLPLHRPHLTPRTPPHAPHPSLPLPLPLPAEVIFPYFSSRFDALEQPAAAHEAIDVRSTPGAGGGRLGGHGSGWWREGMRGPSAAARRCHRRRRCCCRCHCCRRCHCRRCCCGCCCRRSCRCPCRRYSRCRRLLLLLLLLQGLVDGLEGGLRALLGAEGLEAQRGALPEVQVCVEGIPQPDC